MSKKSDPTPIAATAVFITARQVAEVLQCSTRTVWRLVAEQQIPQPIRFNRKLVRFRLADIRDALDFPFPIATSVS